MHNLLTPSSLAFETPTAAPLALKEPVGMTPSSFNKSRVIPSSLASFFNGTRGVKPSPKDTMFASSFMGRSSL
jgi:hypothetical protein